jgi:hypothetical protein
MVNDCDDDNDSGHHQLIFLEMEPSSDSIEMDMRTNHISMKNATSVAPATTKVIQSSAKLAGSEEEDDGEFDETGAKLIACAACSMTCAALLPLLMFL